VNISQPKLRSEKFDDEDDDDDDDGDDDDDDDNNNNNNSPVSYSVAQTLLPGPQVTLAPSHSTDVETGKNFSTAN